MIAGTGDIRHIGAGEGKHYSLNFPLRAGIDDLSYEHIFKPVIAKVMEVYQPTAVVLQCGADSLTGDRLGCFNLTLKGHAECVKFVKSFGLPVLLLGGGGYTVRNVARCWCYETSVMLGTPISDSIPPSDYTEFFRPDYRLHLTPAAVPNLNTPTYLERCKVALLESLRAIEPAPSVGLHYVPPDWANVDDTDEDMRGDDPDVRVARPQGRRDAPGEFYDGDRDQDRHRASASAEDASDVPDKRRSSPPLPPPEPAAEPAAAAASSSSSSSSAAVPVRIKVEPVAAVDAAATTDADEDDDAIMESDTSAAKRVRVAASDAPSRRAEELLESAAAEVGAAGAAVSITLPNPHAAKEMEDDEDDTADEQVATGDAAL